jgi:hypothetical protein
MSALLLLPVLLACATPASTAVDHPDRIFIFALKGDGVDERLLRLSERAIIQAADDAGLDPVSSQDLATMLDIEATRQANGCEGDTACIAEIAGGLGAKRVVTGTLTRLPDGSIDVALTLFDHGGTSVADRAEATARSDGDLKAASLLAGQRLFGLADDDAPAGLRPVLLGVGGVTTAVGFAGLVGLWPLVMALGHESDAADDFASSGNPSDFEALGRAHADYTREAAAWNSWGVGAVAVGGAVATAGVVVLVVGAAAE